MSPWMTRDELMADFDRREERLDAIRVERAMCDWWNGLTDQERCWYAAKAAGADSEVLYAVSKPWKYMGEAYALCPACDGHNYDREHDICPDCERMRDEVAR